MGKAKKPNGPAADAYDEDKDIAATRSALAPLVKAGVTHFRMASAAGAHPDDMKGFLEGRVALTWALRKRLRDQIQSLLDALQPR